MSGPTATPTPFLRPGTAESSFNLTQLLDMLNMASDKAKQKLNQISQQGSSVSIADMFAMQMMMNHLSQTSETASSIVSALNQCFSSFTRGMKGG